MLDCIDFRYCLVPANAFDSRKSQRQAARMPITLLDRVERDLENYLWDYLTKSTLASNRRSNKVIG
jgi:hypothetical protein